MSDNEKIYVHHHPDNKPSPMLDKLVDAVVKDFKRRREAGEFRSQPESPSNE